MLRYYKDVAGTSLTSASQSRQTCVPCADEVYVTSWTSLPTVLAQRHAGFNDVTASYTYSFQECSAPCNNFPVGSLCLNIFFCSAIFVSCFAHQESYTGLLFTLCLTDMSHVNPSRDSVCLCVEDFPLLQMSCLGLLWSRGQKPATTQARLSLYRTAQFTSRCVARAVHSVSEEKQPLHCWIL